jgi:TolB protein
MRRLLLPFLLLSAGPLAAQDTTQFGDRPIRIGVDYAVTRPGLVVLPGAALDSARAIVRRDLDYTDRFEMVGGEFASTGPSTDSEAGGPVSYGIYRTMGAQLGVELVAAPGGVRARLHDINTQKIRNEQAFTLPAETDPNYRLEVHRMADEITRWASGTPGIAATRLLFVSGKRVYRIDSDGEAAVPLTPEGVTALSPVWSPDGGTIAYTRLEEGRGGVIVQPLAGGTSQVAPGAQSGLNITPSFAPDGRTLAFARSDENGTDIFTSNVADRCCAQRLTVGRFADNLSPTFSPDGRRIAFVSTRSGPPQIYVMAANGTDQELLAPFDYGATGASNAPEWSPDGSKVVFHRDVSRSPQIFSVDVSGRQVIQLTSSGRNEDPTWAPDGRHVAFISDRSGRRQIWIFDIESGRVRQLQTPGAARLPSWSRRLGRAAVATNP